MTADNVVQFPTKDEPEIKQFFHCAKCLDELPDGLSPREYTNYEVGMTERGIQVWCKRHEMNVTYMNLTDFWTTMRRIHQVRGLPIIPPMELNADEMPGTLVHSFVNGVYIDPEEYWKHSDGVPPDFKHPPGCPCCVD